MGDTEKETDPVGGPGGTGELEDWEIEWKIEAWMQSDNTKQNSLIARWTQIHLKNWARKCHAESSNS